MLDLGKQGGYNAFGLCNESYVFVSNIVVGLFGETEVKPILIVITKVNRLFKVYSSPSEARSAELSEFTISSREKRARSTWTARGS